MKVLWFANIMMPEFALAIGRPVSRYGGWMVALIDAIRECARSMELTVVCQGACDVRRVVNGVSYIACRDVAQTALEVVESLNPDIIHIHGSEVIAQMLPDKILEDCRTVLSIQGVMSGCAPHYSGCITPFEIRGNRNRIKEVLRHTGVFQIQEKWIGQMAVRERHIISRVKTVLGRTDWDRAWVSCLNEKANYFHVGEILRAPFYHVTRRIEDVRKHTIYCSAAMAYPLKGGHWMLRALRFLKDKYPDVQLRVACAECVKKPTTLKGRLKWSDYHRYLNQLMHDLGVEENVVLLGMLSETDVIAELNHAELFCLPSLCENSPNSLAEAQLSEMPCVATDVGGVRSLLKDRQEGLLVQPADPAALASAAMELFESPDVAREFAIRAAETAKHRHDSGVVLAQLTQAYKSVCKLG